MDIDSKQLGKYLPAIILGTLILFFLFFLFVPRGSEELVLEDDKYRVFYQPEFETYSVEITDDFYNRDAEEVADDIQKIEEATNGSTDAFVDAPAFVFETGDAEQQQLDRLDPNTFLNDPNNGYPGD